VDRQFDSLYIRAARTHAATTESTGRSPQRSAIVARSASPARARRRTEHPFRVIDLWALPQGSPEPTHPSETQLT